MTKRKTINKHNIPIVIFDIGGNIMNNLPEVGTGVTSVISSGMSNAQIADTSGLEGQITAAKNYVVGASDNDALMSEWSAYTPMDNVHWKDIRGISGGQQALNTVNGALSGASTGAKIGGGIGAIVGGVVGLGSGIWGSISGRNKARRKARRLNEQIDYANAKNLLALTDKAEAIDTQNDLAALSAYYKDGGEIKRTKKTNWDKTYIGKYINYAENKDSIGWDSKTRRWYAPPRGKGYDREQRGIGLDRITNPLVGPALKTDKRGSYLTEKDERSIRFKAIDDAEDSYNARLAYAQKINNSKKVPSEKKKAITMSAIYNLGSSYVAKNLFENKSLMKSLLDGTDEEYANKVHEYYKKKGRASRINVENTFMENNKAEGGFLNHQHGGIFDNGITIINNGGTHEENPMNGVPIGFDEQGVPNMVEEGEVIWNNYVFSNRLKPTKEFKDKYKVKGDTFADVAKYIQKESKERPNDPISKRGLEEGLNRLISEHEVVRSKENMNKGNLFAEGGLPGLDIDFDNSSFSVDPYVESDMSIFDPGDVELEASYLKPIKRNYSRYAPIYGTAIGLLDNILSKPDYRDANTIMDAANKAGTYTPISYKPISNYLSYKPLDRNYYLNKLNSQAGATRRAIINQSNGNRANAVAGLLALDYNTQGKYGDLLRQAEEYNLAQRQAVEQFNRGTNMANAEMSLQAQRANQAARQQAEATRFSGITQAAMLRDSIDKQRAAARSANFTSLFDQIGALGKEEYMRDMIDRFPWLLYNSSGQHKKCGGYLTIKNRRK